MKQIILGITGLNGSGKSTVAQYLKEKKGFKYFSVRSYILKELDKRGLEHVRENMRVVANEMRSQHGASYFLDKIKKDVLESKSNIVIESIRTLNEVEFLKTFDALLLGVTAPDTVRYSRIIERKSETDRVSFQEFKEGEHLESGSTDSDVQNLPAVLGRADYVLINDNLDKFYADIDKLLSSFEG